MFDEQESTQFQLPAELAALEQQLAGFAPAPPHVDRDRLMFAAGRATGLGDGEAARVHPARSDLANWFWPAATVAMTAATLLLATMLVWRTEVGAGNGGPIVAQHAVTDKPELNVNNRFVPYRGNLTEFDAPINYLGIRYVALTRGVDALEREPGDAMDDTVLPSSPVPARDMLKELLPGTNRRSS
jgi:hypothetical protein